MKKNLLIITVLLLFTSALSAQWRYNRDRFLIQQELANDTSLLSQPERFFFHTSASFGKDWFNNSFVATEYGLDYVRKINNKVTLFAGVDLYDININKVSRDLAPRRNDVNFSAYMGMDYKVNENLAMSGSVFYNSFASMIGGDFDMQYRFNDNTTLNISATFIKTLQPTSYHYPISYWDYNVFNPFIFGYH